MNSLRISSPITKVLWAGWESTTYALQQRGWQFSCEQDIFSMRFRVAIKHPHYRVYGLSDLLPFDQYYEVLSSQNPFKELPFINIMHMASRMEINLMDNLSNFNPVDCVPSFTEMERKSIEEFSIFRPIAKQNEFVIPKHSVPELLGMIVDLQKPIQADIREKRRKEWRRFAREINQAERIDYEQIQDNREEIVAQLITV